MHERYDFMYELHKLVHKRKMKNIKIMVKTGKNSQKIFLKSIYFSFSMKKFTVLSQASFAASALYLSGLESLLKACCAPGYM